MLQSNLYVLNCDKPSVARRDSLEFSLRAGKVGRWKRCLRIGGGQEVINCCMVCTAKRCTKANQLVTEPVQ